MKKYILLFALLAPLSGALAEPQKIECSTQPSLTANSCEVCYTDDFEATATKDGWASTITNVKIPWKHAGGEKAEIIYDNEQKFPEIKTTLKYTAKPEKASELWTNHETLVWTPFPDHKEVLIENNDEIGLYKLANKASITVTGKNIDDTLLFLTPLVVRDFDIATNEETSPKTRNICVLGKFTMKAPDQPLTQIPTEVAEPAVDDTPSTEAALETKTNTESDPAISTDTETTETKTDDATTPVKLNSADEKKTTVTAAQTKTQTGPIMWIALALSIAFASAWSAWKKQKV